MELKKLPLNLVLIVLVLKNTALAAPQVPCLFIFGDSSLATSDFLQSQIDTGRLSGIAKDNIPLYQTASGEEILKGVNYSSLQHVGGWRILEEQIRNHQVTISEIGKIIGDEEATNHVMECVYMVGLGQFMALQYGGDLIQHYSQQLMILYENGARKVVLIGEGDELKSLANEFNHKLAEAQFTYLDVSHNSIHNAAPFVSMLENYAKKEPQVPCYFIFGDSLADNGNNNLLPTESKANYAPYGTDFPYGATGRFCNGRTMFDLLAELLGFEKYMPPYECAEDEDILRGVNYASGSAGIREESGAQQGVHISMNGQLQNHQNIVLRITAMLGNNETAQEYLNKCLYSVSIGSNDYLNNYYLPEYYPTSSIYTPSEYAQVLVEQYSQQLKELYNLGARKVALVGVGKLGCTPAAIATYGNDSSCVDFINSAVKSFDIRLISVIDEFNRNSTGAQFIYVNSTGMLSGDISPLGITVIDAACCEVGDTGLCTRSGTICQNRSEYAFWDAFHPTEALNLISAIKSYNSSGLSDTYPMDIRTLVEL